WRSPLPERGHSGGPLPSASWGYPRSASDSAPGRTSMTAQGHARTIFRRAIDRKNLLTAEATAREMGTVSLGEALDLVSLVAEVAPSRFDGFARRWLARLAHERPLRL